MKFKLVKSNSKRKNFGGQLMFNFSLKTEHIGIPAEEANQSKKGKQLKHTLPIIRFFRTLRHNFVRHLIT